MQAGRPFLNNAVCSPDRNDKIQKGNGFMLQNIDKKDFYQSKYDFYRQLSFGVVVASALASITYFYSDCQLFGRFAVETLLPRTIILLPLLIYVLLARRIDTYKVMVPLSYLLIHLIMWNTIWAIVYLPDRTHASEGFIIMQFMFLAMGFGAPFSYSTPAHILLMADILISHTFNHYANLDLMLSLGIPLMVGICTIQYVMQKLYMSHYQVTKRLEYISNYDALTGALNRNILEQIVVPKTKRFVDELGEECTVILFDIDHFKQVNDTYGHTKGDIVLKSVCSWVAGEIRKGDYLIRWGGEEFVILLAGTDIRKAAQIAERLRKKVEASDCGVCPVTISLGIAPYDGEDYTKAVQRADEMLYKAKEGGRNQTAVYG